MKELNEGMQALNERINKGLKEWMNKGNEGMKEINEGMKEKVNE